MSTIDDERHAFIRDLLRVLISLYSWAGAVVHGQTEDGHDVIELCDGTRVWTEPAQSKPHWTIVFYRNRQTEGLQTYRPSKKHWQNAGMVAVVAVHELGIDLAKKMLSGPEDE